VKQTLVELRGKIHKHIIISRNFKASSQRMIEQLEKSNDIEE
jgi:hypothetical protein